MTTETNFIRKYADYASTQTDAPKVFHAYVGMTIAGAALGNRVLIPIAAAVARNPEMAARYGVSA